MEPPGNEFMNWWIKDRIALSVFTPVKYQWYIKVDIDPMVIINMKIQVKFVSLLSFL